MSSRECLGFRVGLLYGISLTMAYYIQAVCAATRRNLSKIKGV